MNRGQFITLEGGEGVGKSTNVGFIQDWLQARGIEVVVTREPGGTAIAEQIRSLLLTQQTEMLTEMAELLLLFAGRAQHIHHVIEPALQQGQWVLCDRFTDATFAYQGGGRQFDPQLIAWLERTVQAGLQPDVTLLLDAPVAVGMQRAAQRAALDRFETEQQAFFERVRQAYLQRAAADSQRFHIIQADQSLDAVQAQIEAVLAQRLAP